MGNSVISWLFHGRFLWISNHLDFSNPLADGHLDVKMRIHSRSVSMLLSTRFNSRKLSFHPRLWTSVQSHGDTVLSREEQKSDVGNMNFCGNVIEALIANAEWQTKFEKEQAAKEAKEADTRKQNHNAMTRRWIDQDSLWMTRKMLYLQWYT